MWKLNFLSCVKLFLGISIYLCLREVEYILNTIISHNNTIPQLEPHMPTVTSKWNSSLAKAFRVFHPRPFSSPKFSTPTLTSRVGKSVWTHWREIGSPTWVSSRFCWPSSVYLLYPIRRVHWMRRQANCCWSIMMTTQDVRQWWLKYMHKWVGICVRSFKERSCWPLNWMQEDIFFCFFSTIIIICLIIWNERFCVWRKHGAMSQSYASVFVKIDNWLEK